MLLKRLLYVVPLVAFLGTAGFFLWGLDPARDPSELPSVLLERPAPEFELPAIPGSEWPGFSRAALAEGTPTLVNFFASWCVACKYEHPVLMRLAEAGDIRLLGVNYKDKPAEAIVWLQDMGNPYEAIGADLDGRVAIEWGLTGVPETFVVDGQGVVRHRHIGPVTPKVLETVLRPMVRDLS